MNWTQFKDPVSHMCLAGTVVVSWSLIQEVAGSSPFTLMTNIFVTDFSENVQKKHPLCVSFQCLRREQNNGA